MVALLLLLAALLLLLAADALRNTAPPLSVTITGHVEDDACGLAPNVWSTVTQWSPSAFETAGLGPRPAIPPKNPRIFGG